MGVAMHTINKVEKHNIVVVRISYRALFLCCCLSNIKIENLPDDSPRTKISCSLFHTGSKDRLTNDIERA